VKSLYRISFGLLTASFLGYLTYSWFNGEIESKTEEPDPTYSFFVENSISDSEQPKKLVLGNDTQRPADALNTKLGNLLKQVDGLSSEDLLSRVRVAMSSTEVRELAVGHSILNKCFFSIQNLGGLDRPQPQNLSPDATRLFEESHRQLRSRCESLLRLRLDDLIAARSRWLKVLSNKAIQGNDENIFVISDGRNEVSAETLERMRNVLDRTNTDAFFWVSESILEILQVQASGGRLSPDSILSNANTLWAAIELSRCKLGYECTSGSLRLLVLCTGVGICGPNIEAAVLAHLATPLLRLQAQQQSDVIVEAIAKRDFHALGLASQQVGTLPAR